MRVTFIGTRGLPAAYSGFETCVENVGRRMVERGHEVTVFCRSHAAVQENPRYLGMRLRWAPSVRTKHLETISHTLASLPLIGHGAVVCMGVGNAPAVRLLELSGRRLVWNIDGFDWERAKWSPAASAYLRRSAAAVGNSRSVVVVDAQSVQQHYTKALGRPAALVPYGAEPPADRGTETLAEIGVEPGGYLLFVGRLEPENGAHDLLAALAQVPSPPPAVIVGDAPYAREYIAGLHASAVAGTVFAGFRFGRDYQQLTANAQLFVLAATVGGTHPVLLEQMAAGNCILARDVPSHREVLGDAGVYWTTPRELADAIQRCLSDEPLRRSLGAAARQRQQARYDWETVTSQYIELCEQSLRPA